MANYFSLDEAIEELRKLKNSGEPITQEAVTLCHKRSWKPQYD